MSDVKNGFFNFENFNIPADVCVGMSSAGLGDACDRKSLERILQKLRISIKNTVRAGQVHGNRIELATTVDVLLSETDGLLTVKKNICLLIFTADCLPVFIFENESGLTGLLHCGWKGLSKGILTDSLPKKLEQLNINLSKATVILGAAIGKCCYEVKPDFWRSFPECATSSHFDLISFVKNNLLQLGIKKENIYSLDHCTGCDNDSAFSYRKRKTDQRMVSFIMRKEL
ncbi:MAG: polyphenol oxidase family protein [bacterium]